MANPVQNGQTTEPVTTQSQGTPTTQDQLRTDYPKLSEQDVDRYAKIIQQRQKQPQKEKGNDQEMAL